ncbi:shikimate dehydrogenase [Pseudoneobacillus sp. C159]
MKKLYAVIGDPIAHSMSPMMHNDLFVFHNIDAHYHPLLVKKEQLQEAIVGLKAIGISGFNVTIPHKTNIIPFLDEVDPLAAEIGAVNTVVNQNGNLVGYNTDGLGFKTGLKDIAPDFETKKVLVIGAGGASRAIYYTLAKSGVAQIDICNRTLNKVEGLIEACPYQISSQALTLEQAERDLGQYSIIIQTTQVGMAPDFESIPIRLNELQKGTVVSDIIYNPLETRFLKEAKQNGAIIQNGIEMFVYQGALAFQYWTGVFPDTNRMQQKVLSQLGGILC